MLDEKFWEPGQNRFISTCMKEFFNEEPLFNGLEPEKLGEIESKLFKLLQEVKEPIYREVDREYLREDVSVKIKEWCGEKGEYVLSLFSFDEIDCIVEIWQQRLADTEPYWEVNWEVLDNVLEDDYQLSALDEYGESEIKEYINITIDLTQEYGKNAVTGYGFMLRRQSDGEHIAVSTGDSLYFPYIIEIKQKEV